MTGAAEARDPARVLIAGGGFAALEAALALRAIAGSRVQLTLLSASTAFAYRPAAPVEAISERAPQSYDLRQIADDLGAGFHPSALEAVSPRRQTVRLESGRELSYDALVLATGARATAAVPGALTFRDQRDLSRLRAILNQLTAGSLRRLVFAVPSRWSWSLPAYELALLSAHVAARASAEVEITVVTPEVRPLAIFGDHASTLVESLLSERDIRFIGSATPHGVSRSRSLDLQFGGSIPADRVVALPALGAHRIPGVPGTWSSFIPTDPLGRVEGLTNVYAAGDVTTFPIKQGGLAAQQADRVAHTIATGLGVELREMRESWVLRARLLTGDGAVVLRTELDPLGRPVGTSTEHRESRQANDLKVFGRYLTPYLSLRGSRLPGRPAAA